MWQKLGRYPSRHAASFQRRYDVALALKRQRVSTGISHSGLGFFVTKIRQAN